MSILFNGKHSYKGHVWKEKEASLDSAPLHASSFVSKLLQQRKVPHEEIGSFLSPALKTLLPDPQTLLHMDKAVQRVIDAIHNQEKIIVYGDYDVDGLTATAQIMRFFHDIGYPIDAYIPHRQTEGYGLSVYSVEQLAQKTPSLVITVDCGTSSHKAIEYANSLNIDIVVIDHHTCTLPLPSPYALINPHQPHDNSGLTYLCASGLTFLFLVRLRTCLRRVDAPDIRYLLDLVALGTICDVMPLKGVNRAFVSKGLEILSYGRNHGLSSLLVALDHTPPFSVYHLGFVLGPHINAPGRLDSARPALKLLTSTTPIEAQRYASQLMKMNAERKRYEESALQEAFSYVKDRSRPCIIVYKDGWHQGVIGILAGRLKEHFGKPSIVITFDGNNGKGSARSLPHTNIGALIQEACKEGILINGGGHALAGGFSLHKSQIEAFEEFLCTHIENQAPTTFIDHIISPSSSLSTLITQQRCLEPFGQDNPQPIFLMPHVIFSNIKILQNAHISAYVSQASLSVIAFRACNTPLMEAFTLHAQKPCHLIGTLQINDYTGKPQMIVCDIMEA